MNTDKMKQIINPVIFENWTNCRSIKAMISAKEMLKFELENINNYSSSITDSRIAEYYLLCIRTGTYMDLDLCKIRDINK